MSARVNLIAETDGAGQIAWIWRLGPDDRYARPISEPSEHLAELGRARFHGSTPEAISDWFARHVHVR
jgi:hypothetical protein